MPLVAPHYDAAIQSWEKRTEAELKALAVEAIQNLCESVVTDTPVNFGFLRGGWQPSIGEPAPFMEGRADPTGTLGLADLAITLSELKLGDTFYFTNHVIYARRIEYGFVGEDSLGRYYNQKGQFYLGNNAARWQSFVTEAAATLWGMQ